MPPVLRSRKSLPPVATPTVEQQKKPKPKRKAKQKPENAAPKHGIEKNEAGLPNESADAPAVHAQSVHQHPSPSPAQHLHVSLTPDARATRPSGGVEQRAAVIMASLDRQNSSEDQSDRAIGENPPSHGGASVTGSKRARGSGSA
ncbi:hypothetical protein C7212DRAFT_348578 [Tuber magnatum]|uniref:Uncharacterized protein n=1 Tax=Tuber magnatum TaxID=42249 RepID=A0A317SE12_9PEZI|nr:hypothetical protein C7212DRAFT_348578 [Tuber magnatum]